MDFTAQLLVDYFTNNDISLGCIIKPNPERFTVQGTASHTDKVTPKQVIATHGLAGKDMLQSLAATMTAIRETMASIDVELLYDDLIEQGGGQNLAQIVENYFGETTPVSVSAMARKLAEDTLHFKRTGFDFVPRTPEEVAEIQRLKALRAEKAALRERSIAWLRQVLASSETVEIPQEQELLVKQLSDYLMLGHNSEALTILSSLQSKLSLRELTIRLLKKTGRFPEDADEFLLVNGIHAGFSQQVLEAAENLTPYTPDGSREDYSDRILFSIDDAETKDIDDALSCTQDGDGNVHVGIYIADPACFVPKDSILDEAAVDRPLSMYLPTTTVTMFPEILSNGYASLLQDSIRPCLAFNAIYDQDGELLDWSIVPAQVKITQRLTYEEADELIQNGTGSIPDSLRLLHRVTKQLHRFREEDGAVTLNRPELKIRVRNDEISIVRQETDTPSHNLVGECMIQCNNFAARYALVNDIPIIYRAQEKPNEPVSSVRTYEPCFFDQQVRKMRRSTLSTYPAPHFGLGLDLYTQVSSPLRRYADLIIQRQLSAHLRNLPLPYKQEELFTVLDNVDKTSAQNKALEREANNYWILEYIRRHKIGETFNATIVRIDGPVILGEIDDYCVRGIVYTRDYVKLGERVQVSVKDVHPNTARLTLELID